MQQHNLSDVSIRSGPSSGLTKICTSMWIKHKPSYLFLNSVHDCVFGHLEGVGHLDGVRRLVGSIVLGGVSKLGDGVS